MKQRILQIGSITLASLTLAACGGGDQAAPTATAQATISTA